MSIVRLDFGVKLAAMLEKPKKVIESKVIKGLDNILCEDTPLPNFDERARTFINASTQIPEASNPIFKMMSFDELMSKEYVNNWVIEGLFERESVGMVFGNSASGKSLIVQEMCFCTSHGIKFHGMQTQKSRVAYIAGEGGNGLQKRFKAIGEKYGIRNAPNLFISRSPAAFLGGGDKGWFAIRNMIEAMRHDEEGGEVGLIVIDTLHRNFGDGDENSAKDFAEFMKYIDEIKLESGAAVLLIHHSGNESKDRARGSSSMKASMDWEFSVTKRDNVVTMENTKMKDFEPPKPISFEIIKILDSVILESTAFIKKTSSKRLSQNSSKTLESLHQAVAENGICPPANIIKLFGDTKRNLPKKVVTVEQWRIFAYQAITVDSDGDTDAIKKAKKMAFLRSRKELDVAGLVGVLIIMENLPRFWGKRH